MTDSGRNFPYRYAWPLFLLALFAGAGMVLSENPRIQFWGLALLLLPLVTFGAIMLLYYWRSRRLADEDELP